jgi:ABC-type transport system involved in multi-copper enzyme maturation permease subunit
MTWLTLRQLRASAAGLFVAVAAAVVALAVTGPALARLYHNSPSAFFDRLTGGDTGLYYAGLAATVLAPALIGLFWGAPMIARELENGTHRMVWTQSVSRTRWLASKLGLTALVALAATGVLTLAVTWWSIPFDGAQGSTRGAMPTRLNPVVFMGRGVAPLGYALFALVVGALLGAVLRRTLTAMAVTLVVLVGVQIAVPLWIRPHLAAPVDRTVTLSLATMSEINLGADGKLTLGVNAGGPKAWRLADETVDASGRPVAVPSWFADCLPPPPGQGQAEGVAEAQGQDRLAACFTRLTDEGYRQHVVYQPDSNFWSLQWAELGLLTVLSGLTATLCFWWVRRRLS